MFVPSRRTSELFEELVTKLLGEHEADAYDELNLSIEDGAQCGVLCMVGEKAVFDIDGKRYLVALWEEVE